MRRNTPKSEREPTITLINVVFLMLIFFLVAGTLAAPTDKELKLVSTSRIDTAPPADALVIHADGRMTNQGITLSSEAEFMQILPQGSHDRVRIMPDRDLPATTLVAIGRALRQAGAGSVVIITERGLE